MLSPKASDATFPEYCPIPTQVALINFEMQHCIEYQNEILPAFIATQKA
jgi:hypothetical protein